MRALLLFFSIFQFATSLNILVYVLCLGQSHLDFMDSIVDTLVDRGHTVDVLMGKANSLVKSNGTKKVRRRFIYGYHTDCPWSKIPHLLNPFEKTPRNYDGHKVFENISSAVCEIGLSDPELYKWMSQEKYDLGVLSDYEFCGLAIFEQYGIKTKASVSALPLMDHQSILLGLPNSASVTHALFDVEDLSTIFGRFFNLLRWTNNYYNMHAYFSRKQAEIIHKYLDSSMNLDELARNYDIVFVNANELVERPRPISHKVKYIGGINMKPPKPVNPELDKIMSISTSGVVIFSFGTQVKSSTFSPEIRKSFANAFRKFPDYTFIWKYEKQPGDEKIFGNTTNLHFLNWLPQTDILTDSVPFWIEIEFLEWIQSVSVDMCSSLIVRTGQLSKLLIFGNSNKKWESPSLEFNKQYKESI
ncbi:unnamed protein product [Caenorhabditis angaria]|uniref:glucuronosyltransferase n=1 Tax=Caenorhabditis angaria TaxID=860376 RepID=A0A9P1ISJ5_9PELO|nr:unnamed protein product [Caenorhabditis angaria]